MARHDDVGPHQSGARRDEPTDERHGRRKRRVGDNAEGAPREPEIRRVGDDDAHATSCEPATEHPHAVGVEFERDHTRATMKERLAEHAVAGADVKHQITRGDRRFGDDARGAAPIEPVPPPAPRDGDAAHGS